jgi:integrase
VASIAKRQDGRWRGRYRDADGREHARHFTRKVDAQRWLDEVTAAVVTGQYVDPIAGRVTFADYYARWAQDQVWTPGTRRAMSLAVRTATFGDVPLRALRRSHVERSVKAMVTTGLAPGTIRTRHNNARAVLRAAVRDRLLATDPSDGVALPRQRRAEVAMSLPTVEEVRRLREAADPTFRAFVALAAFAGLRLGEIAGLQVRDIDFLRRQLTVARQVQRERGGSVEVRAPKYGSERMIYLPDDLITLLSQHVRDHRPGDDPARWMFPGDEGNPLHQNSAGYWWRRARDAAKVPGVKLHDLRHFYASGLIAAGCDVVTVQRALGHAKATTTLNTYAHLWPTAEDRTRSAAASLMASVSAAADSVRTGSAG